MAIQPEDSVPILAVGKHDDPREGACLMEYVSVLAGERFTDHPRCTDGLLAYLARLVNDAVSTSAARGGLTHLAPELIGTAGADARTREAVIEVCFRVACRHGVARRTRARPLLLARSRLARYHRLQRALHTLQRRLSTHTERDAALYDLLAAAAATYHRGHQSPDEHPDQDRHADADTPRHHGASVAMHCASRRPDRQS